MSGLSAAPRGAPPESSPPAPGGLPPDRAAATGAGYAGPFARLRPALFRAAACLVVAIAALLALPGGASAQEILVDRSWSLKPSGLGAGDQFRLIFVTSGIRDATSSDIADYNTFVQEQAATGHMAIRPYSDQFRVVGSTRAVDARDNTSTTGTGVPIYWLNGSKVADNYADFYDGSWDDEANPRNQSGGRITTFVRVYTGSDNDGTEYVNPGGASAALGSGAVRLGRVNSTLSTANPLNSGENSEGNTLSFPFYGLSPVFTVKAPPSITDVSVTSRPADGTDTFGGGERVEVTVTFDEAVEVQNSGINGANVSLRISLGDTSTFITWQANFLRMDHPRKVVFGLAVTSSHEDDDGLCIGASCGGADTIRLSGGGAIVAAEDGVAAVRNYDAVQTSWNVDGSSQGLTGGVCDRHPAVRAAIVLAVSAADTCADVTDSQVNAIGSLSLPGEGIVSLRKADFQGLTGLAELDLSGNALDHLPVDLFEHLDPSLRTLKLNGNPLGALTAGVFDGLTGIRTLELSNTGLTELPAGLFAELDRLEVLQLVENRLRAFPAAALADVAGTLQWLIMRDNGLESIDAGALDGMTELLRLELQNNALASLPDDLLRPLTKLEIVELYGNPGFNGFAPVVEAIPEQSFGRGQWGQRVDLEAVLGASPWGDNVIWTWPQIGSSVTLNDADTATPWFTAPAVDADTRFTFTATATGRGTRGAGLSKGARTARVTVQGPASIADVSVTSRPADGSETFKRGDRIEVTVTFSEPVHVTVGGGIGIGLRIGADIIDGEFHRQDHPNKLIFRHVVVEADVETSGIVIGNDPETPQFEAGEDDITLAAAASIRADADDTDARVRFDVQQTPWEVDGSTAAPTGGICGHGYHPKVLAAILDAVPGGNTSCDRVTDADLAAIASLDLSSEAIDSLHKRDFEGLTGLTELNLSDNALDRLPDDLFEHVATLTGLRLRDNDIAALPARVFAGLTALKTLDLRDNDIAALPAGVFDDLTDLWILRLQDNALASLPDNVFASLTQLRDGGLLIEGNPGFEDFVPRVTVAAQTVLPRARVDLEAIVEPNPWGSNLVWSWTRTDTGGETVTLEDADTRTANFVAPAPAVETQLAFEVTATGRGTAGAASPSKATEAAAVTVREATPPELTGAEVGASGDTLTLTFNKELDNGPGKLPPGDAFTVRADGDKVAVQFVTEGGRSDNFVLRLPNNAVTEDQTVTVSYAVPESGTVIEDTVGNDALAFTYFEVTNNSTVDVTPPVPESAVVGASGDILTLTFNEDLDRTAGVPPASAFTVKADGVAVAVQSVVAQALDQLALTLPTAAIKQGQTVTVSYEVPDTGTVIEDTSGNDALAFTDFEVDNNSTADGTPPIPASAEVGAHGGSLALTFNENLDIGPVRVPPATAFTVKADGVEVPVQSVAVLAGTFFDTLLLNLSSTIGVRQIVTVSYEVPDTGTVIADVAGNEAVAFEDFPVTNNSTIANTTPPVPASGEVLALGDNLTLTFNEALDIAAGFPPASAFTVKADGVEVTVQLAVFSRSDTLALNLSSTIKQGQTVTVSYTVPDTGTVIADVAGNEAKAFDDFEVTNNSTVDGTPPIPASAQVVGAGDRLSLTFNEDLDIAAVPPASAFIVKADGVEVAVQSVLASILDTLALRFSSTIKQGQTVTVSYTVPDTGTVIADVAGNEAVTFEDFEVTNNSTVEGTPPVPASGEVLALGDNLTLTFNEALDIAAGFPPASAFTVKADGVEVTVQLAVFSRSDTLALNLSSTIKQGQTVTVSYTVPDTGTVIADVAGNPAVGFTDFEVDNDSTADGTPPVPASAEVEEGGDVLNLTFSEDLDLAAAPFRSAFTVKADGVEVPGTSVFTRPQASDQLALGLSAPIGARQIVTVSYAVPTNGRVIEDLAGNEAVAFEDFPVTNNSTVENTTAPVPASAVVPASGASLTLTFNENLDIAADKLPPASAFTVKADGVVVTVQDVAPGTDPDHFVLNLPDDAINQCQTVTVDYAVPATNPIQDTDDDAAVGFTDFPVTNNSTVVCPNLNPPVFGGEDSREFSVEENVPLGTEFGDPVTATDPDGDTLTYSVDTASPYASYFQIDSATGQLRTNVANGRIFNHENDPNEYEIVVVADDGRGRTAQIAVAVSVTDVDEPPDAPVAVTVTGSGTTSLQVTWTAPPNAGRPDIEHYDVQYREAGASRWMDGPQDVTGTSATVMPVDAGKSYEVQVRATNHEDDGPWAGWGATPVTIEAEHEEIGGGLEDLKFTLTREGDTTDALVATVTITQEQSWLGNSDLEHEVAFLPRYATAELTIAASKFSFAPTASGDLTARVSGAGIFGGSDTVEVVSTAEPPIAVGLDMSAYSFAEDAEDVAIYVVATLHPDYPRPPARARDFGIAVSTESGTATFREDFVSVNLVVDFFADDYRLVDGRYVVRKNIGFEVVDEDDHVYEGPEGLVVKVEASANLNRELVQFLMPDGTAGDRYPVTITDMGNMPVLSLSVDPSSIAEEDDDGTPGVAENVSTVTVAIINPPKTFAVDRTVTLTFSGGTQGTHYSVSPTDADPNAAGHQVVFPAETASLPPVTVTAAANDSFGLLTLTVTGDLEGTAFGTRTITILDDETMGANIPATGEPVITGVPQVGQTLTAGMGDIDDDNGVPTTEFPLRYSFKWVRVAAGGAETNVGTDSRTYTLIPSDAGSTIRVEVSFIDGAGNPETVSSAPTMAAVVAAAGACIAGYDWCTTMTVEVVAGIFDSAGFTHHGQGDLDKSTIDYGSKSFPVAELHVTTESGRHVEFESTNRDEFLPRGSVFDFGGTEFTADMDSERSVVGQYRWGISDIPANFGWIEDQKVTVSANLAPAPDSGTVDGTILVLTHAEDLDRGSIPAPGAYTVKVDGGTGPTVSSVAVGTRTVTLTLAMPVTAADIVTVDYDAPTSSPLQDVSGLDAPDFTNFAVTNNTPVENTTPPVPASAEVPASGASLTLTFNEDLDIAADRLPPASAFTVKADGDEVTVESVALGTDPDNFVLNLPDEAIKQCHKVTVDYEVPATNPIRDTDDNDAVGFTDFPVTNNSTVECPNDHSPVFGGDDPRVFTVEENVPLGTDIGVPVTATDEDGDTLTYNVDTASPYSGYFQIDSATGQLQTNVATGRIFNHESAPATGYDIIVIADDGRGRTAQITVVVSVTDVDEPPDAPVAVMVTGSGTTSLEVTWTAPPNDSRPAIEHYDVQYREVGESQWRDGPQDVDVTSATIMSVDAGKSYEVQVRATNDEGDGPWAAWGADNSPATGKPMIGGTPQVGQTLTAGMGTIADADNLPTTTFPTGYSFQWVRVEGSTETDITGETDSTYTPVADDEGATIKVRVSFTDGGGYSETVPSDAVGPVVAAELQACVLGGDVWCATLTVQDLAGPSGHGCANSQSGKACSNPSHLTEDEFRHDGTDYDVTSITVATNGDLKLWLDPDPTAPTRTLVLVVDGERFALAHSGGSTSGSRTGRQWSGTGLSWSTGATVELRLVEGFPPLAPAAPRVNGIGDNDTSLKVTWGEPNNAGPPITHYDLRYRTGSGSWQNQTGTNATNATIAGLTTGTEYDVQVRASNADGDGEWSPSGQGTPGVVETEETRPKGSLRLVDNLGNETTETTGFGRLEVLYGNKNKGEREWGTVCNDRFDSRFADPNGPEDAVTDEDGKVANIAATLACQWSGAGNEGAMVSRPDDWDDLPDVPKEDLDYVPIWLDDVRCAEGSTHWRGENSGTPTALHHCYNAGVGLHNCDHTEDVYLQCTGSPPPESATQEAAAPLTASFEELPETHDGATAFTFRLSLSDDIANSDVDVRDSAFEVTGGSVTDVGRVDGRNDLWEITVTPDGTGNVGIVLLPARACGTAGALCTADGRALTTALLVTVPASPQQAGALTAVFADMPADHGGAAGFTFTLRFSESFPIGYVTMRDHAFTVTNGRVTRARRLDNPHHENQGMQPNREWEITVAPDTGAGDVTIALPETTDCAATGAVCTEDGTMLSGAVSATVPHTHVDPNAAAAPPLRASFANVPAEHDGGTVFTFEVRFSEAFRLSYVTMRDDVLTVTNARVTRAQRLDNPHHEHQGMQPNRTWKISVRPDAASEDVTIVLPATTSCDASGAVCTGDGRKLSNTESATVAGPPSLSIADAQVDEAAGATLEFTVSLSRAASATVTVDWATADGTATAGSDYTADSGTLTFAPDETSKTVAVAVLDDSHDEGNETLTVTLSNPSGAYLADGEATGTIENTDHMPQAWLSRFGRTVAEQVLDAVEERIRSAPQAGVQVTVAGQRIGAAQAPDADALEEAEAQARLEDFSTWLRGEACRDDPGAGGDCPARSREVAPRDLLTGTSFALTTGADGIGGGLVSLWGRGAVSSFDGREGDLSLSGEVTGAMLGADWTRERWTMGLMLSHARGEGSYRGADSGKVSSTVTGLYPYGRYAVTDRVTVWGAAGYGAGTLTLTPEDGEALKTDMDLVMAAAGLRGTVVEAPPEGGPELAVKTDAMAVRTSSEAVRGSGDGGAGNLAAATADVTRLRLGLEGTWRGLEIGTGTLVPRLEIGVRHDGGDAETGFGLDLGGGLAWSDPGTGLRAEVSGRGLLTHESAGFRERGIAGSFGWDPTPGSDRGPSLTLSQTMGVSARGGADALLGRTTLAGLAANDNGDELERRRLELQLGYGFGAFGDRFTATPEVGFGMSAGHRDYSLAWRFVRDRRRGDIGSLEFSLEATRRESANDDAEPEHGVGLRMTARW